MARSIGRPMRFFLAKRAAGPCLIVAERIDEIFEQLRAEGLQDQFHYSYTRMVPAHHVMHLRLTGCPDPNPTLDRFVDPPRASLPADIDVIGRTHLRRSDRSSPAKTYLATIGDDEPIGVPFSGGVDSGAVLCALIEAMRRRGQVPQRLKAFTLVRFVEAMASPGRTCVRPPTFLEDDRPPDAARSGRGRTHRTWTT